MTAVYPQFNQYIQEAAKQYGVPPSTIEAIITTESSGNPKAKSNAGALGLMQIMPKTAESLGLKDPYNPKDNIFAGTKYYAQLLKKYGGNEAKALAAYHGDNPNAVGNATATTPSQIPNISNPYQQEAQQLYQQTLKQMQEIQPQMEQYMKMLVSNNKAFQDTLKEATKSLQSMPSPPEVASYTKIAQENSKLMPLMSAILTIGTAVFGNKSGITLGDKFSAMFAALKDKNLYDYNIAREQALDELNKWKADIQAKFDKLNTAVNLAAQGKNANDLLIQAGMSNLQLGLQNTIGLFKMVNDMSNNLEKIKLDMIKANAEVMRANAYQKYSDSYAQNVMNLKKKYEAQERAEAVRTLHDLEPKTTTKATNSPISPNNNISPTAPPLTQPATPDNTIMNIVKGMFK